MPRLRRRSEEEDNAQARTRAKLQGSRKRVAIFDVWHYLIYPLIVVVVGSFINRLLIRREARQIKEKVEMVEKVLNGDRVALLAENAAVKEIIAQTKDAAEKIAPKRKHS